MIANSLPSGHLVSNRYAKIFVMNSNPILKMIEWEISCVSGYVSCRILTYCSPGSQLPRKRVSTSWWTSTACISSKTPPLPPPHTTQTHSDSCQNSACLCSFLLLHPPLRDSLGSLSLNKPFFLVTERSSLLVSLYPHSER